jgi:kynureninase
VPNDHPVARLGCEIERVIHPHAIVVEIDLNHPPGFPVNLHGVAGEYAGPMAVDYLGPGRECEAGAYDDQGETEIEARRDNESFHGAILLRSG